MIRDVSEHPPTADISACYDSPKTIEVVRGIVVSPDGSELAIAQRSCHAKTNRLRHEFAGGQVEIGETHYDALRREIAQELGLRVLVDEDIAPALHRSYHSFINQAGQRVERNTWFYLAWALDAEITPDPTELETGFWIEQRNVPRIPNQTVDTQVAYALYMRTRALQLAA